MIVSFMYHRISHTGIQDDIQRFTTHLQALSTRYPIVWPGEKANNPINFCLTFDDAYFDFYHYVFPILQRLNLKAVLAVPIKYILETTDCSPQRRLSVPYAECMQDDNYLQYAPFCTWQEIKTMSDSGLVKIASHSYHHYDLTQVDELDTEIIASKQILEAKLSTAVECFFYPYGKMNRQIQHRVNKTYPYAFRIGNAVNRSWQESLFYRINADPYWQQQKSLGSRDRLKYQFKYWQNKLRLK